MFYRIKALYILTWIWRTDSWGRVASFWSPFYFGKHCSCYLQCEWETNVHKYHPRIVRKAKVMIKHPKNLSGKMDTGWVKSTFHSILSSFLTAGLSLLVYCPGQSPVASFLYTDSQRLYGHSITSKASKDITTQKSRVMNPTGGAKCKGWLWWQEIGTKLIFCFIHMTSGKVGRGIGQAVSRRLPAVAARVRARVRSCGICAGKSGTIYLSIYLSICVSVRPSVHLSMSLLPFVGPQPLCSSLILYTLGRSPWMGDQPVERPLPTHRINSHIHPFLEWRSYPRSQGSRERKLFMP
jgi:hypothetical protein